MSPAVSVIVATFNDRENLLRCLASLQAQSFPSGRREIIVVDDGSTDGTAEAVRAAWPDVVLIAKRINTGPDDARNAGVQHARSNVVAFVDSDCTAPPEWLERLTGSLDRSGATVVGGRILHRGSLLARVIGVSDFGEFLASRRKIVGTIPTCNMGIRREVLLRHPFEPGLRMLGDVFFSHTLVQQGVRPLYDPDVTVFHHPAATWRAFARRAYRYGDGFVRTRRARPSLSHSRWIRAGWLPVVALSLGRAALDVSRLIRFRRAAGIPVYAVPAASVLLLVKRVIGAAGALHACRE